MCVWRGVRVRVLVYKCRNARLSSIWSVWYRNKKKTNDAGTGLVPDQAKAVWHFFLVRYRTQIIDARMLMPTLVLWMPMPSYGLCHMLWSGLKSVLTPLYGPRLISVIQMSWSRRISHPEHTLWSRIIHTSTHIVVWILILCLTTRCGPDCFPLPHTLWFGH